MANNTRKSEAAAASINLLSCPFTVSPDRLTAEREIWPLHTGKHREKKTGLVRFVAIISLTAKATFSKPALNLSGSRSSPSWQ